MRLRLFLSIALLLSLLPTAATAQDIAVYGAPASTSWNTDVVNKLIATGQFDSVTGVLVNSSTPTLANMLDYDAILVYSDTGFNNATTLGDRLADYMDAGGGIVMCTFAYYGGSATLSIKGRIRTDNYLPFDGSSQSSGGALTLSILDPSHAIMDGVSTFNGGSSSYRNNITFHAGVDEIANWSNGVALVAAWSPPSSDGTIAGLNFYPPSQDSRGDFWSTSTDGALIMANALTFVGGGSPPIADAGSEYLINEGSTPVLNGSGSTDPNNDIISYEWDCTDDGVFDVVATTATTTGCTYGDQDTHILRLRVTDAVGNESEDTATVTVQNVAPTLLTMVVPPADENAPVTFTATAYDIVEDTVSFEWDFGDGSPTEAGPSVTHTYPDDGSFTIELTLSDEDGGVSTPSTSTLTVSNLPPVIDSMIVEDGVEGSPVDFTASATDVPADTVELTWNFGDGTPDQIGGTVTHTYDDDGEYTVTLSAADEDGGLAAWIETVAIGNIAPVLTGVTLPSPANEGGLLSFSATGTDVSGPDELALTYTWDWGDSSSPTTNQTPTHSYADDGTYTITVTVQDDDGGSDFDEFDLIVANVDPIIGSIPPTFALEAALYSYAPVASDPGDEVFAWSLVQSPASMTIDELSGQIYWLPTFEDSLLGTATMEVAVDDGDGGTDSQLVVINVSNVDTDGDGMPDGWEEANGLDPEDPTDALDDPDEDGINNVGEFQGGTDPFDFDGPEPPINLLPADSGEAVTLLPEFTFQNSYDPQGDEITYDLEVHGNATLTALITSVDELAEGPSSNTTWPSDVALEENSWAWWQVRGHDGTVYSNWSEPTSFFVNEVEEAPPTPTALYPLDGELVALPLSAAFVEWTAVEDPEGSAVTYHVRIWAAEGEEILGEGTVGPPEDDDEEAEAGNSWIIDVALVENTTYRWDVAALDELGNSSAYTELEPFFFSTENEPAEGLAWIDPEEDGDETTLSPRLVVTEAIDPEGTPVQYRFELDLIGSWDSPDFLTRTVTGHGDGTASWDLDATGNVLAEDSEIYGRVRATDSDGVSSAWVSILFIARGENDPPSVPELVAPEDDTVWDSDEAPVFVINNSTDPEGDEITYDIAFWATPHGLDGLAEITGIAGDESGATSIDPPEELELVGDVYWTARAVDALDAASDWADPFLLRFPQDDGDDDDSAAGDDDDDDDATDCSCENSLGGGDGGAPAFLGLLALLGLSRRRRR
jgi:MYXO-CTERM domain-containing protein